MLENWWILKGGHNEWFSKKYYMVDLSLAFLILYFVITSVFFAVDAYFWWIARYPRWKIGRWNSRIDWSNEAFKRGVNWLPKVPAVPVTQNTHLLLYDIIQGKFIRKSVQAWQTGGLLIGVSEYSIQDSRDVQRQTIDYFINKKGEWRINPQNIDFAILAFGFLKYSERSSFLKPAMDYLINLIEKQIGDDGLIAYSLNKNNRYVDTLGLVCPFLVLYDNIYGTSKYTQLALAQLHSFIDKGMFKETFLPVHAYETTSNLPIGVYGWGRGTGWFILGITDTFLELKEGVEKEILKEKLFLLADYYLQFQRDDGGFGIFLQNKETYDSSATAVFAYFLGRCYELKRNKKYLESLESAINKLMSVTRRNGALDYCQGDTIDVGIFSQNLNIMPFAQGILLRTMKIYSNPNFRQ